MTQITNKLITVTRQDISRGLQIAQSCHSVADFAYYFPVFFNDWRKNSNYKICLSTKDEKSLKKIYNKLVKKGAPVVAFYEPDLNNQLTAISFYGTEEYRKITCHLPLALKEEVIS